MYVQVAESYLFLPLSRSLSLFLSVFASIDGMFAGRTDWMSEHCEDRFRTVFFSGAATKIEAAFLLANANMHSRAITNGLTSEWQKLYRNQTNIPKTASIKPNMKHYYGHDIHIYWTNSAEQAQMQSLHLSGSLIIRVNGYNSMCT